MLADDIREIAFWSLIVLGVVGGIPLSDHLNRRFLAASPGARSFAWGYWFAVVGAYISLVCVAYWGHEALVERGRTGRAATAISIYFAFLSLLHVGMFLRNRWAWVLGTIFQFNPIIWIVNGVYIRNRWGELSGNVRVRELFVFARKLSVPYRMALFGTLVWPALVGTYVMLVEPYGYMGRRDVEHLVKVILLPPLAFYFIAYLYSQFFASSSDGG